MTTGTTTYGSTQEEVPEAFDVVIKTSFQQPIECTQLSQQHLNNNHHHHHQHQHHTSNNEATSSNSNSHNDTVEFLKNDIMSRFCADLDLYENHISCLVLIHPEVKVLNRSGSDDAQHASVIEESIQNTSYIKHDHANPFESRSSNNMSTRSNPIRNQNSTKEFSKESRDSEYQHSSSYLVNDRPSSSSSSSSSPSSFEKVISFAPHGTRSIPIVEAPTETSSSTSAADRYWWHFLSCQTPIVLEDRVSIDSNVYSYSYTMMPVELVESDFVVEKDDYFHDYDGYDKYDHRGRASIELQFQLQEDISSFLTTTINDLNVHATTTTTTSTRVVGEEQEELRNKNVLFDDFIFNANVASADRHEDYRQVSPSLETEKEHLQTMLSSSSSSPSSSSSIMSGCQSSNFHHSSTTTSFQTMKTKTTTTTTNMIDTTPLVILLAIMIVVFIDLYINTIQRRYYDHKARSPLHKVFLFVLEFIQRWIDCFNTLRSYVNEYSCSIEKVSVSPLPVDDIAIDSLRETMRAAVQAIIDTMTSSFTTQKLTYVVNACISFCNKLYPRDVFEKLRRRRQDLVDMEDKHKLPINHVSSLSSIAESNMNEEEDKLHQDYSYVHKKESTAQKHQSCCDYTSPIPNITSSDVSATPTKTKVNLFPSMTMSTDDSEEYDSDKENKPSEVANNCDTIEKKSDELCNDRVKGNEPFSSERNDRNIRSHMKSPSKRQFGMLLYGKDDDDNDDDDSNLDNIAVRLEDHFNAIDAITKTGENDRGDVTSDDGQSKSHISIEMSDCDERKSSTLATDLSASNDFEIYEDNSDDVGSWCRTRTMGLHEISDSSSKLSSFNDRDIQKMMIQMDDSKLLPNRENKNPQDAVTALRYGNSDTYMATDELIVKDDDAECNSQHVTHQDACSSIATTNKHDKKELNTITSDSDCGPISDPKEVTPGDTCSSIASSNKSSNFETNDNPSDDSNFTDVPLEAENAQVVPEVKVLEAKEAKCDLKKAAPQDACSLMLPSYYSNNEVEKVDENKITSDSSNTCTDALIMTSDDICEYPIPKINSKEATTKDACSLLTIENEKGKLKKNSLLDSNDGNSTDTTTSVHNLQEKSKVECNPKESAPSFSITPSSKDDGIDRNESCLGLNDCSISDTSIVTDTHVKSESTVKTYFNIEKDSNCNNNNNKKLYSMKDRKLFWERKHSQDTTTKTSIRGENTLKKNITSKVIVKKNGTNVSQHQQINDELRKLFAKKSTQCNSDQKGTEDKIQSFSLQRDAKSLNDRLGICDGIKSVTIRSLSPCSKLQEEWVLSSKKRKDSHKRGGCIKGKGTGVKSNTSVSNGKEREREITKKDFSKLLAQWSNTNNEKRECIKDGTRCSDDDDDEDAEEDVAAKPLSPKSAFKMKKENSSKAASFFNEFLE